MRTIEQSLVVDQPIDEVWDLWTDVRILPDLSPSTSEVLAAPEVAVPHGGQELDQRRQRNKHERRVAVVQHRQIAQRVDITRAARAALIRRRDEHEVIHDELKATVE